MIKLILLLSLTTFLSAKYTNCEFKNENHTDICKSVVKDGVSYEYANQFLASYFKMHKFDEVSWEYLKPKHIKKHQENEKKANNTLIKFVPKMIANLEENKEYYDYAEQNYKVNREIIAAILLKETKLGMIKPTHDAFLVFNTIVTRVDPKSSRDRWLLNMGKTNMASIIKHCYKKGVIPEKCNLPSSYAGAVGIPQFMPNSFVYAESYQNRVFDLNKMEDAIASVARFMNEKVGYTELINWDKMPNVQKIEAAWYEYDLKNKDASFVYETSKNGKEYNCFTKGKPELSYMKNYTKKIMSYNNSSNYAVGVIRLAYDAHLALSHKD